MFWFVVRYWYLFFFHWLLLFRHFILRSRHWHLLCIFNLNLLFLVGLHWWSFISILWEFCSNLMLIYCWFLRSSPCILRSCLLIDCQEVGLFLLSLTHFRSLLPQIRRLQLLGLAFSCRWRKLRLHLGLHVWIKSIHPVRICFLHVWSSHCSFIL